MRSRRRGDPSTRIFRKLQVRSVCVPSFLPSFEPNNPETSIPGASLVYFHGRYSGGMAQDRRIKRIRRVIEKEEKQEEEVRILSLLLSPFGVIRGFPGIWLRGSVLPKMSPAAFSGPVPVRHFFSGSEIPQLRADGRAAGSWANLFVPLQFLPLSLSSLPVHLLFQIFRLSFPKHSSAGVHCPLLLS